MLMYYSLASASEIPHVSPDKQVMADLLQNSFLNLNTSMHIKLDSVSHITVHMHHVLLYSKQLKKIRCFQDNVFSSIVCSPKKKEHTHKTQIQN